MSDHDKHPEQDPAEGSRAIVDHELRHGEDDPGADPETREKARRDLKKQVRQKTELPQKGSA
jgi:hypothetical protein